MESVMSDGDMSFRKMKARVMSHVDLEDEDGEDERHDDLQQVHHERHEEVRERKLARRHSRDPRPIEESLVALHDDDHGAVAEGHAVHDGQDDARRHEVREGEVFGPVDRLLEHQGDAGNLLRDAAGGDLRNISSWLSRDQNQIGNSLRSRTSCSKKCWKASTSLICNVYAMCWLVISSRILIELFSRSSVSILVMSLSA